MSWDGVVPFDETVDIPLFGLPIYEEFTGQPTHREDGVYIQESILVEVGRVTRVRNHPNLINANFPDRVVGPRDLFYDRDQQKFFAVQ